VGAAGDDLNDLNDGRRARPTVHPTAVVGADVTLGPGVTLHPYVVVLGETHLGEGTEAFPGAVIGKPPAQHPTLSRPTTRGPVRIGAGCSIGAHAVIYEDVELGEETLVGDLASIREGTRIGRRCVIGRLVTVHTAATVGDGSRLLDHTHLASDSVVGRDCFLGVHVTTASDNALGRLPYDPARVRGPRMDDGAAVGSGGVLLPGVHIGARAVVAAGAVVTADVEPDTEVFGSPARPRPAEAED
jgi:acetyltransferase-like isoleucine patch superfamily enzyme